MSKLHGEVSRNMWQKIYPGIPTDEIPISHVTNGVHTFTWLHREMLKILDAHLGTEWRSQIRKKLPISFSFDIVKEQYVRKGRTLRLNSWYGIRIKDINDDSIVVQHVPYFKLEYLKIKILGEPVEIKLGERKSVEDFSIELLNI